MLSSVIKSCGRTSAFTFLVYPTCEEDRNKLFDFLSNLKVPSCLSPLHNKDVNEINTETGETEFKKEHYHCVIDFGSGANKTVSQMFDLITPIRDMAAIANLDKIDEKTDPIKASAIIKVWKNENCVKNMRSLLRYFKHLDNPEKFQYLTEDYKTFCGFDIENRILSQEDSLVIFREIKNFVRKEECYLYCDLVDYADECRPEWLSVLIKSQYNNAIIQYMKSLVYKNSGKLDNALDPTP